MLEELSRFLGGDSAMAITYLIRATEAKPDFIRSRLDLAKIYLKHHNPHAPRTELSKIVNQSFSSSPSKALDRERQEARIPPDLLPLQPSSGLTP